jgi:ketosteroid isomerase-like protein
MSDDPTEALPQRGRSLRILVIEDHPVMLRVLARLLDHFRMYMRSVFVCSTLLLFASVAYGAGSYQRTRDGKMLIWNDSLKSGEEATWSGKRDKIGFATGSGTLTWYKVEPTIVTGSNIPDARRHAVVISRYSGEMVQGKFEGAVTYVDANGKRLQATFVSGSRAGESAAAPAPRPRKKPTLAPTPAVTVTPAAEQTPTPTPERTSAPATPTPTPAPEQSPSQATQETPPAVPQETATLAPEQMATPTSEQQARRSDVLSTIVPTPTPRDDSLRSLAGPPLALPEQSVAAVSPKTHLPSKPLPLPSSTLKAARKDANTVAALDAVYQSAVRDNDIAIMDQILADDFVLVTGLGASLTKADLIKEAREKRTIYEHQEEEEGTQRVRVWGDTAVVTALLRIKGTRDQNFFDYKVWFSDTYVRTPTGWRHVFGQASIPLPKPDAK